MVHMLDELLMIVENIFLVKFSLDHLIFQVLMVHRIDEEEFLIHIDLLMMDIKLKEFFQ
jgi:hypothetical protein